MFSAIRKRPHLKPSTVIATFALVFAMSGGAYAASKYVITSTKQISPKVLKSLKGAIGKNGAAGVAGAQGPAGAAGGKGETGAAGPAGAKGETGPAGPAGAKGESGAPGAKGAAGAAGSTGPTGSPWTAGGTLPKKATETGGWVFPLASKEAQVRTAISFTIPLATELEEANVQSNPVGFPTGASPEEIEHCPGSVTEPKAESGFLCVYASVYENGLELLPSEPLVGKLNEEGSGTSVSGARLSGLAAAAGELNAYGTWAVTG